MTIPQVGRQYRLLLIIERSLGMRPIIPLSPLKTVIIHLRMQRDFLRKITIPQRFDSVWARNLIYIRNEQDVAGEGFLFARKSSESQNQHFVGNH